MTSLEVNPEGAIRIMQTQTPMTQSWLKSEEDLRWMIFNIKGILKNGRIMAATNPIFSTTGDMRFLYTVINLVNFFNR